ncbi:cytochrome P450 [Actinorugispora endophytica]|uniref:Cytochrome P450 n=1 Tax=Actinorugispora endophytica TaxID=1605990 RepID=A0A4R6V389_9ACTN|nr:cytochrome P450 [Actinorugispora endophytica]TDQ53133.1 cytochrome P450 [Actinorugispora endophytica]
MSTPQHTGADGGGCPARRLYGPEFETDPGSLYRDMRAQHGPVAPVLLDGDIPAWLVIGYRELHYVLSTPSVFARSSSRWSAWDRIPPDWPLTPLLMRTPTVLHTEGEEHRRRAGAISDALAGADHHETRMSTARAADRLIDGFCAATGADLRADYATRLPAMVLGRLYGLDDARADQLAGAMTAMIDGGPEALDGQRFLLSAMTDLVAARRVRPGPDLVSRLLAHPAGITDEEAVPDLVVMLGGGHQPTTEWLGNTLRLMLTDDRFAASLSGARRSVGAALNEVLWEDTPTQNYAGRFAVHDVELGGQLLRAGDLVILGLAGANADPRVSPDPRGAPAHGNHAHMSFSHGEHRCPYPAQELAEIIVTTGVEVLLDRLPDVELAISPDELRWRPSPWMRGLVSLPVAFTPVIPLGDM